MFDLWATVDDLFIKIQLYKTHARFIQNFINNIIFVLAIFLERIFFYILRKFYNLNLVMKIIQFYDSLKKARKSHLLYLEFTGRGELNTEI